MTRLNILPAAQMLAISSEDSPTRLILQSNKQARMSEIDPWERLAQLQALVKLFGLPDIKTTLERLLADQKAPLDAGSESANATAGALAACGQHRCP